MKFVYTQYTDTKLSPKYRVRLPKMKKALWACNIYIYESGTYNYYFAVLLVRQISGGAVYWVACKKCYAYHENENCEFCVN